MTLGSGLHDLAVLVHTFVRYDAAPVEGFDDIFLCSRYKSL